jgi:hypothetical protein
VSFQLFTSNFRLKKLIKNWKQTLRHDHAKHPALCSPEPPPCPTTSATSPPRDQNPGPQCRPTTTSPSSSSLSSSGPSPAPPGTPRRRRSPAPSSRACARRSSPSRLAPLMPRSWSQCSTPPLGTSPPTLRRARGTPSCARTAPASPPAPTSPTPPIPSPPPRRPQMPPRPTWRSPRTRASPCRRLVGRRSGRRDPGRWWRSTCSAGARPARGTTSSATSASRAITWSRCRVCSGRAWMPSRRPMAWLVPTQSRQGRFTTSL